MEIKITFLLMFYAFSCLQVFGQKVDSSGNDVVIKTKKELKIGIEASYQVLHVKDKPSNHYGVGLSFTYGKFMAELEYVKLLDEYGVRLIFPTYYILNDDQFSSYISYRIPVNTALKVSAGIRYSFHYLEWEPYEAEADSFIDYAHSIQPMVGVAYQVSDQVECAVQLGYRWAEGVEINAVPSDILNGWTARLVFRIHIWKPFQNKVLSDED